MTLKAARWSWPWFFVGIVPIAACTLLVETDDLAGGRDASDSGAASESGADSAPLDVAPPPPPDATAVDASSEDAPSLRPGYRSAVLADAPVLYLMLDETAGSEAKDEVSDAASAYVGSMSRGVPGAFPGSAAVRFHGGNAGVSVGDRFAFPGTAPFTLELWARPDPYDAAYRFLVSRTGYEADLRQGYAMFVRAGGNLEFERFVDGAKAGVQAPLPAVGVFHHVVATYDGRNLVLYVDGAIAGTVADLRPAKASANAVFWFGRFDDTARSFPGALDEVAVYDKALSAARVTAHYAAAGR